MNKKNLTIEYEQDFMTGETTAIIRDGAGEVVHEIPGLADLEEGAAKVQEWLDGLDDT